MVAVRIQTHNCQAPSLLVRFLNCYSTMPSYHPPVTHHLIPVCLYILSIIQVYEFFF